jgi:zinc transport system permease protein
VSSQDLWWVFAGVGIVFAALFWLWQPLLSVAVHEELAAAEGVHRDLVKSIFVVLLAIAIAVAIKVVGVLLAIAFLIMPAAAARPFAKTPERMAVLAAIIAIAGALAGLQLSLSYDIPGGPAIVLILALLSGVSLMAAVVRRTAVR